MDVSLIVAMANNRAIGKNNKLPWHLPADLQHFKKTTLGKPIVMGRNTFESIGKALPGRKNIVISRQPGYQAEGCTVANSIEQAIKAASPAEEVMIIGGATLYQQSLAFATRLYLTQVDTVVEGDSFFPEYADDEWQLVQKETHSTDEKNDFPYTFLTLERKG